MPKNNLRRKRFIPGYNSQVTLHHWEKLVQKLKAGTWMQELKQKPWTMLFCLILLTSSVCFLIQLSATFPGLVQSTVDLALQHPSLLWVKHYGLAYRQLLIVAFFQLKVPLPKDSSLLQVDKRLANTGEFTRDQYLAQCQWTRKSRALKRCQGWLSPDLCTNELNLNMWELTLTP